MDYHYIRELVLDQTVTFSYVPSHDQTADLFAKSMTHSRHNHLVGKFMLFSDLYQFAGVCKWKES